MKQLTKIANKYGTDRGTECGERHGYTEIYDQYFKPYKGKTPVILELGSYQGAGIKTYNEYFKGDCLIYAFDCNMSYLQGRGVEEMSNVVLYKGDVSVRYGVQQFVEFLKEQGVKFDIIIDDCSHQAPHQSYTLYELMPFMNVGGIYIIEDLHTHVWEDPKYSLLYSLMFNQRYQYLTESESDEIKESIDGVEIYTKHNPFEDLCKTSMTSIITFKNIQKEGV